MIRTLSLTFTLAACAAALMLESPAGGGLRPEGDVAFSGATVGAETVPSSTADALPAVSSYLYGPPSPYLLEYGLPGLTVLKDWSLVTLTDPEYQAGFWSVMEQESGGQNHPARWELVNGSWYKVISCMQLLLDSAMWRVVERLGFTEDDLLVCGNSVLVGQEWYRLTGWNWVAKPQYRLEGRHDGNGQRGTQGHDQAEQGSGRAGQDLR